MAAPYRPEPPQAPRCTPRPRAAFRLYGCHSARLQNAGWHTERPPPRTTRRGEHRTATRERPWSFDGDGDAFKLAVEAKRIDLAFLFDPMMAVHTSNVEPLPHQITAVYESMLPRQPLRFVLADDPGAGKTIMAGLYIREFIMRADSRRILVVAPGGLVAMARRAIREVRTPVQCFFIRT
jgi:hypothetical protein